MKPDLHDLALDLYIECLRNRLTVDIEWIPRIMIKEVMQLAKLLIMMTRKQLNFCSRN